MAGPPEGGAAQPKAWSTFQERPRVERVDSAADSLDRDPRADGR
jgi:hypothetical protein